MQNVLSGYPENHQDGQQSKYLKNQKDKVNNEENFEYYQEYMRLYIANVVLTNQKKQLKDLLNEKNDLLTRLGKLEAKNIELTKSVDETGEERKKRQRRSAQEIERHFKCPVENCSKQYGAEGSLNQHIKIKHPELVKDWPQPLSQIDGSRDSQQNQISDDENDDD